MMTNDQQMQALDMMHWMLVAVADVDKPVRKLPESSERAVLHDLRTRTARLTVSACEGLAYPTRREDAVDLPSG